jgi:SSS family solute:Na+ symporter
MLRVGALQLQQPDAGVAIQWTELVIFTLLFGVVTGLGFYAARWKTRTPLDHLDEWGLAGRRFGLWVIWFLIGGDIFTTYTFVAVPALMFGAGAGGFFALPYVVLVYPLVFLPLLRLWSVSRVHRYVTPADFVQGRYGSTTLALVVALTGIVATMAYIALQLAGLQAVLRAMGLNWHGLAGHLPLIVAFVIVAAYTYRSGLRAPALIAFVKAFLIYSVIIVAADAKFTPKSTESPPGSGILLSRHNQLQYVTFALGSALALFLYPHALTPVFASGSRDVIKRNMMWLPIHTIVLGLFALLGYAAIATHTEPDTAAGHRDLNTVVPNLFEGPQFPSWFAGIAFAAIGIGALVPASIMSIAAANLWTRNIYKAYLHRDATAKQETQQSRYASLVVKLGAVALIMLIEPEYSITLQLLGGVVILQTLPVVAIPLYTRWFHIGGLLAGWAVGMAWGLSMFYSLPSSTPGGAKHFGDTALELGKLSILGWEPFPGSQNQIYTGFVALLGNLVVASMITIILRKLGVPNGSDETRAGDYHSEGASTELNRGNALGTRRATLGKPHHARLVPDGRQTGP